MRKIEATRAHRGVYLWALFFIFIGLISYEKPNAECDYGYACNRQEIPKTVLVTGLGIVLVLLLVLFGVVTK